MKDLDIRTKSNSIELLEVKVFGRWGTVCADGFGYEEATVACRMLGYQNPYVYLYGYTNKY